MYRLVNFIWKFQHCGTLATIFSSSIVHFPWVGWLERAFELVSIIYQKCVLSKNKTLCSQKFYAFASTRINSKYLCTKIENNMIFPFFISCSKNIRKEKQNLLIYNFLRHGGEGEGKLYETPFVAKHESLSLIQNYILDVSSG